MVLLSRLSLQSIQCRSNIRLQSLVRSDLDLLLPRNDLPFSHTKLNGKGNEMENICDPSHEKGALLELLDKIIKMKMKQAQADNFKVTVKSGTIITLSCISDHSNSPL